MSGGKRPDPNAKRRNKDKRWSQVVWSDDEWVELIESGEVPPIPADVTWGRRACQAWESVWSGPVREELLPQHVPLLELLCDQVHEAARGCPKAIVQVRIIGEGFGMSPMAVRSMRLKVDTKPSATKGKTQQKGRKRPRLKIV